MSDGVAILGFGRFGRALAEVFTEAKVPFRAFDPGVEVPAEFAANDLASLVAGATYVVIAVPVPLIESAVQDLVPYLTPQHTVFDVGSVKVIPVQAMERHLGDTIPWVGTHPLFGPTSLALGERPLRVVVCPNSRHPEAVDRVKQLWASVGCIVHSQEVDEHDRGMAETHALTFFVAKGLHDIGAGVNVPHAPPSFRAIERSIDLVRSDAGHLFGAIHRDNPFAEEARTRLLDALTQVNEDLRIEATADLPRQSQDTAIALPELETGAPALAETRELIDALDEELIALLGRRAHLSRRAGRAKATMGKAVRDPGREASLMTKRKDWGQEQGVDATSIDEIFESILRFSRRIQGGS